MKKRFLSAALALAVAGSWAFYPKAAEPAGYMMVVGRIETGLGGDVTVTTLSSDGQRTEAAVTWTKPRYRITELRQAEVAKLNQLRQNGWRVVNTTSLPISISSEGGLQAFETTYLLEKP